MDINRLKKICRPIRIILGLSLIGYGLYSTSPLFNEAITSWSWSWFYLGAIPLMAGICNFCPACLISKQCDVPQS